MSASKAPAMLDVLHLSGVPGADNPHRWPVDVVTQILRDHPGTALPVRHGMTKSAARRMVAKLEGEAAGMWGYECETHRDEYGNYTVEARATRVRLSKFATGEDTSKRRF